MPHPYPNGLHCFSLPIDGLMSWPCAHVHAPQDWADYARDVALSMLSRRLGRLVDPSELDAGVWVMPEVQS
jgi:hypothetical protein